MNKEKILKEKESILVFKYIIPSMAGMLGMSLYIFADTFFIANGIGSLALTSLNVALPTFSIFTGTGLLVGIGGATLYSINKGRGDEEKKNKSFYIALKLGVILGIIYTIIGNLFCDEIATVLGASTETFYLVKGYIQIIFYFAIFFIINNIIIAFVRNDGSPNLSMIAMLLSTLGNIILDYVFIYIFKWGMEGAALATGFAPIVSISIASIHFFKKSNTLKIVKEKLSFIWIKEIISGGIGSFITEMASGGVIFFFNIVLLKINGDIAVAAYGIIANVALVAVSIFNGLGQGIQPLISLNFGANEHIRVKNITKYALGTSLILGIVFFLIGIVFPYEITAIFNSENIKELTDITVRGLRIYFVALIFMGINMTATSIYQSMEMAKESMLISLLRGFIIIVIGLLILPRLFGINGVWITVPITEIITMVLIGLKGIKKPIK